MQAFKTYNISQDLPIEQKRSLEGCHYRCGLQIKLAHIKRRSGGKNKRILQSLEYDVIESRHSYCI